MQLQTFSIVLIQSSPIPSKHQSWMHPLTSLMPWLLQSFQGSYTWLVPFLIILNCSMLLASNLINFGSSLGHILCQYHWLAKYEPLNYLFFTLASRPLHHWITSLWLLLTRWLWESLLFSGWHCVVDLCVTGSRNIVGNFTLGNPKSFHFLSWIHANSHAQWWVHFFTKPIYKPLGLPCSTKVDPDCFASTSISQFFSEASRIFH